jgi:hypothetical protein
MAVSYLADDYCLLYGSAGISLLENINRSQLLATGAEPCGREEQGGSKAETPEEAGIVFFFRVFLIRIHESLNIGSAQSRKSSNFVLMCVPVLLPDPDLIRKNLRLAPDSDWIRIRKHPWVPDPESVTH